MKMLNIHIQGIKNYLNSELRTPEFEGGQEAGRELLLKLLSKLEDSIQDRPDRPVDRLLKKDKFIDAVMTTVISGRIGSLTEKEMRQQLEKAWDTGQLAGVGLEHRREYNVAVIIRGGTFSELWADRPGINIHKFDVDEQGSDPVLYQPEEAEYASTFNADEILNALESEFE